MQLLMIASILAVLWLSERVAADDFELKIKAACKKAREKDTEAKSAEMQKVSFDSYHDKMVEGYSVTANTVTYALDCQTDPQEVVKCTIDNTVDTSKKAVQVSIPKADSSVWYRFKMMSIGNEKVELACKFGCHFRNIASLQCNNEKKDLLTEMDYDYDLRGRKTT